MNEHIFGVAVKTAPLKACRYTPLTFRFSGLALYFQLVAQNLGDLRRDLTQSTCNIDRYSTEPF